ncbi:beta-ketoacyl synthase N-terminal-like domain-containing protein, partial [Bradyrhizobium sp. Leaf401]|uniref:acyl carrier protein n=1 Tax=Bradyrhizobium sp. Leaf401 TaxID=2876564 RepID=UPI001E2CE515
PLVLPASNAGLGYQVIAAESDGVVRQSLPPATALGAASKDPGVRASKPVEPTSEPEGATDLEGPNEAIRHVALSYLKERIGDALKISPNDLNPSEVLESYGIDSIFVVSMTNVLKEHFKSVTTTLFFEYQTIDALVGYLVVNERDKLIELAGLGGGGRGQNSRNTSSAAPAKRSERAHPRRSNRAMLRSVEMERTVSSKLSSQDIAVIGMSGRYAEADDVDEFWRNLREGRNCITEIPKERWDWKRYYSEEKGKAGSIYTKWGGFIRDIDKFEPLFFRISPREAELMDPQERLFLEEAYKCIEDAGYLPAGLCERRKVGVFVGVMNANYHPSGAQYWSIANRVSYVFDFNGPSFAVDSACSSSLTAFHLAVESLRAGTSECAIVGGVNLIVDPNH